MVVSCYITFHVCQGIGNGLPLGAVVTTPEIANVMAQKIQFNTFGGNPVCSAGGLAVLRVIDKEKRQAHCADVGSHLIGRLRSLQDKHDSNYSTIWHLPFALQQFLKLVFNLLMHIFANHCFVILNCTEQQIIQFLNTRNCFKWTFVI